MKKIYLRGSDHFIDTESAKIIDKYPDADIEKYFGDELNKGEFFTFINSVGLFDNKKIAFIRKAESIKPIEEFITSTKSCVNSIIILAASAQPKNISKVLQDAGYDIKEESTQAASWQDVSKIFKEHGIELPRLDAEDILNMNDYNLAMIESEAEKLGIYKSGTPDVTTSELMDYLSGSRQESVYMLIDAITEKRPADALRILRTIALADNDFKIFYGVSKRIINIYMSYIAYELIDEKYDSYKQKISGYKRYWKRDEAARMIGTLARIDIELKTGRKTFENAIAEIIGGLSR